MYIQIQNPNIETTNIKKEPKTTMKRFQRFFSGTSAAVLTLSSLLSVGFTGVAHAAVNTCDWTGATDLKFSTATNWANCGGAAPVSGDAIVLNTSAISANTTLNNDISNLSLSGITVTGSAYYYTVGGNSLTLTGPIAGSLFLNTTATLGSDVTVTGYVSTGSTSGGSVDVNGHTLTLADSTTVYGKVVGSGAITIGANANYTQDVESTFGGSISVASSSTVAVYPNGGAPTLNIASGGYALFCGFAGQAYAGPISVGGDGGGYGALRTASNCNMGGPASAFDSDESVELTGPVTLTADTVVGSNGEIKISGALSGDHTISMMSGVFGKLTIASSSNTSQTGNGQQASQIKTSDYKDNSPTTSVTINTNEVATIDGTYGDVHAYGGTLKGTGTIKSLAAGDGVILAPGHSPGKLTVLTTLNIGDSTFQAELLNKDTYDQFEVGADFSGSGVAVVLANQDGTHPAILAATLVDGYKINKGDVFVIINNKSSTAVQGTFKDLPEGATLKIGDGVFSITYKGGDGNDVVLAAVTAPTAPDTGFALMSANPIMSLSLMATAAGALLIMARRFRPAHAVAHKTTRRRK